MLAGIPIVVAGVASSFYVVTANAWMQVPTCFDLEGSRIVAVDPVADMFNVGAVAVAALRHPPA